MAKRTRAALSDLTNISDANAVQLPVTPSKKRPPMPGAGRPPGSANKSGRNRTAAARAALYSTSPSPSAVQRPTTDAARATYDREQRQRRELEESLAKCRVLNRVRRGLSWTFEECVLMIQFVIAQMLYRGADKTTACQTVALCGKSYQRVLRLVNHWFSTGEVLNHNAPRGQASSSYSRRPIELTAIHQAAINEEMTRLNKIGKCVTARLIQKFLQAEPHNVHISNRRLFNYLHSWKYVYARAGEVFPVDPEWHRWRMVLQYDTDGKVKETDAVKIVTYHRRNFDKRASANSTDVPTAKQLRRYLSQFLKRRPELVPTQTQQLMDAESFSVLFTPPLEPRCQPIEQLWGTVKYTVAEQYVVGRTADQTRAQLIDAFYTHQYDKNAAGVLGVSPRQCAAMVKESQEWMVEFVKNNPDYLSGPLDKLMWESGLMQRPADVEEVHLLRDRRIIDREWNLESAEDLNTSELLALNCLGNSMDLTSVDRINTANAMEDDDDCEVEMVVSSAAPSFEPQLLLESSMYPLRLHPSLLCYSQSRAEFSSARALNFLS